MVTKLFRDYSKFIGVVYFFSLMLLKSEKFFRYGEYIYALQSILAGVICFSFLIQQKSKYIDIRFRSFTIAIIHLSLPMLLTTKGVGLYPKTGLILIVFGICITALAVLELSGSFGVLPALRDIKVKGLYSIVRHPIYVGYCFTAIGFLLKSTNLLNFVVFLGFVTFMILRVEQEELALKFENQKYNEYCKSVKFRLIPCLY